MYRKTCHCEGAQHPWQSQRSRYKIKMLSEYKIAYQKCHPEQAKRVEGSFRLQITDTHKILRLRCLRQLRSEWHSLKFLEESVRILWSKRNTKRLPRLQLQARNDMLFDRLFEYWMDRQTKICILHEKCAWEIFFVFIQYLLTGVL